MAGKCTLYLLVPPLRERQDDLPVLIDHFLECFGQRETQRVLPQDVLNRLLAYHWPGNVRELQNVLCRYLTTHHLSFASRRDTESALPRDISAIPETGKSLNDTMEDFEKQVLIQALEHNHWHREKTAGALGITVRNLRRKITKYQLIQPYKRTPLTTLYDKSGQV